MSLTPEQVEKVALLARLRVAPADCDRLAKQLRAILEYVEQLQRVPTDGVEPLAHPLPVRNVFRPDDPAPSLSVADALANAPDRQGDFFGVPAVLD